MCSLLTGQAWDLGRAGQDSASSPQPAAVPGTLVTSLELERKGSHEVVVVERGGGSYTHTAGLRSCWRPAAQASGRAAGWGATPLPLFSRVTVPQTHHTRQTLCFPVRQLWEVNRKPGQARRPGHPRSYRSSSSRTLSSASGERGEVSRVCPKELNVRQGDPTVPHQDT